MDRRLARTATLHPTTPAALIPTVAAHTDRTQPRPATMPPPPRLTTPTRMDRHTRRMAAACAAARCTRVPAEPMEGRRPRPPTAACTARAAARTTCRRQGRGWVGGWAAALAHQWAWPRWARHTPARRHGRLGTRPGMGPRRRARHPTGGLRVHLLPGPHRRGQWVGRLISACTHHHSAGRHRAASVRWTRCMEGRCMEGRWV